MQEPPTLGDTVRSPGSSRSQKADGLQSPSLDGFTRDGPGAGIDTTASPLSSSKHDSRQQILSDGWGVRQSSGQRKSDQGSDKCERCPVAHPSEGHCDTGDGCTILGSKPDLVDNDVVPQESQYHEYGETPSATTDLQVSAQRRRSLHSIFPQAKPEYVYQLASPESQVHRRQRAESVDLVAAFSNGMDDDIRIAGMNLGDLLAERVSCIDSIRWLGHHLPETVLAFLIDEIEFEEAEQDVFSEYGDESCLSLPPEISRDEIGDEDDDDAASDDYAVFSRQDDDDDDEWSEGPDSLKSVGHAGYGNQWKKGLSCHVRQADGQSILLSTGRKSSPLATVNNEELKKQKRRHSLPKNTAGEQTLDITPHTPSIPLDGSAPFPRCRSNSDPAGSAAIDSLHEFSVVSQAESDTNCRSSNESVVSDSQSSMAFHQGSDDDGDSFFDDSDDEHLQNVARLRQHRFIKTQDSLRKLHISEVEHLSEAVQSQSVEENEDLYFPDGMPPAMRHDCALLFVDISGFTKLSTLLDVEPFSKTTNSFFQMIVEEIEAYGGDVLKFAGDALFAEWQATTSNPLEGIDGVSISSATIASSSDPWHGLGLEECVLTAATCAARIVDKCSEFPVYSGEASGPIVATLNVHCGLGFGEVVGVHLGDHKTRMEYLVLGDPIEQVAKSILLASRGEVVASPEALLMLEETAELDEMIRLSGMEDPQIIATKNSRYFNPKGSLHVQKNGTLTLDEMTTKPRRRLAERCEDWDLPALKRLRLRMSRYVHPVVLNDEFALKVYPGDRYRAQERHRSEAELRRVYTVFIMPLVSTKLTGDDEDDCRVIMLLNEILLVFTRELKRYNGQLRQFIVDDKGVVLIANFGLRGSTFPNMVAERAIPFTTAVQTLLRAELDVECQIGATFGEAYCGVVGGVTRHEYAVLGPSINLAARLMGNPKNTGFLVDDAVKEKAGSRQFRALPPVKAKGYPDPVPIFEPSFSRQRSWTDLKESFVGRDTERSLLQSLAESLLDEGGPAKLALLAGKSGAGKSALCMHATEQIREICHTRGVPHIVSRSICNEGDSFIPFSIVRPLFADILSQQQDSVDHLTETVVDNDQIEAFLYGTATEPDVAPSLVQLVWICRQDDVPPRYVEIICRLILTRNRADILLERNGTSDTAELAAIARFIVSAFLRCTVFFDLVVFALDDISNIDQMSWLLVELLHCHAQNLLIMGTARTVAAEEMHIEGLFWEKLHKDGLRQGSFVKIELPPMTQTDIDCLIAQRVGRLESDIDANLSREVYVQSGGMPNLASELLDLILEGKAREFGKGENDREESEFQSSDRGLEIGNVGELVLHRMDALPSSVRAHLNLGAVLGITFDLMDVVTAFEQYRSVIQEERFDHAQSVLESLQEGVTLGIIEAESRDPEQGHSGYKYSDHPFAEFNTTYRFTHSVWRTNILRLTLNEFKRDVHSLIAQSMETVMDSQHTSDYRVLTKLFSHWKESGSARKATRLALKMGRSLEDMGLTHQSILVYNEALDMWKGIAIHETIDESIGGLTLQLVETLEVPDLECLTMLHVALGRCLSNILDPEASADSFQNALSLIQKAPSSTRLEDRSIVFPMISGLFDTLRFGPNEDFKYEVGLVHMFLRETELRGDSLHKLRALSMQGEMFARHGKLGLALGAVASLRGLYDVETHSRMLNEAYGSDRSAQCVSQSALWSMHIGLRDKALELCDAVLDDFLPQMLQHGIQNSFLLLYPIIWIMKDHGMALRAKNAFDEHVVSYCNKVLDERGTTPYHTLHFPVLALLDLVGTSCTTHEIETYSAWLLVDNNGRYCSELNHYLGSLGRTADSITAEMCLLLARRSDVHDQKVAFVKKGVQLARTTLDVTGLEGEVTGMIIAYNQVKPLLDELLAMNSVLHQKICSRRSSCGF